MPRHLTSNPGARSVGRMMNQTLPTMAQRLTALIITALICLPIPGANDAPLEDQAGWDCHTMGNRICGTDVDWPIGGDYEPDTGAYIGGYN